MTAQTLHVTQPGVFTRAEWRTRRAEHTRYQRERDLVNTAELGRLRIQRRLYRTERRGP
jgi:hypothetical protein